jgi:hypothetical protein
MDLEDDAFKLLAGLWNWFSDSCFFGNIESQSNSMRVRDEIILVNKYTGDVLMG